MNTRPTLLLGKKDTIIIFKRIHNTYLYINLHQYSIPPSKSFPATEKDDVNVGIFLNPKLFHNRCRYDLCLMYVHFNGHCPDRIAEAVFSGVAMYERVQVWKRPLRESESYHQGGGEAHRVAAGAGAMLAMPAAS